MAETYVNLDDILKKKKFSYDSKQYAVTEKDVRAARKIEIVSDEDVGDMETAIKALANRCATLTHLELCIFCGIRGICNKYRTVRRSDDV